jgi:hypothetical protein
MAKKKKKAEAANETKSDAQPEAAPNDAATPTDAAAAPAVATLPEGSVALAKRDVEHFLAVRRKTKEAEIKWAEVDHFKEMKKIAAAEAKQLDAEIRRMIRNGPDDPTLFDLHDDAPAEELTTGPDGQTVIQWDVSPHHDAATASGEAGAASNAGPAADESWKAAPLYGTLKQPKNATLTKALKMIEEAEYLTVGKLEALRALRGVGWYDVIPWLGAGGANEVNLAIDAYLASTRDKAVFDAARGGAESNKSPTLTFDLKFDVVRYIFEAEAFHRDVKPAAMKKVLAGTLQDAERIGVVYRCDDDGIRVEKHQGRSLPTDANLIPYKEACSIIKGLATQPVKTKHSGEPRVAEMVKYFVERFGIANPLNAEQLRDAIKGGGGSQNGVAWETNMDGAKLGIPGRIGAILIPYDELAELVKVRLDEML